MDKFISELLDQPIVQWTWNHKYRLKAPDGTPLEATIDDSFRRVVAGIYVDDDQKHAVRALAALRELRWSPGGRQHAGAGTERLVSLINCFMSPVIEDSMKTEVGGDSLGILDAHSLAALTQQMGGGIGMDFSTLRPRGALVAHRLTSASGPRTFMEMWNAMCATIMAAGERRGAMMATLRCDHPDIEEFVTAKHTGGALTNFNVSVLATDKFMRAIKDDGDWELGFSIPPMDRPAVRVSVPAGNTAPWYVWKVMKARALWDLIIRSTYDHAEPGVIFIDRVNHMNNLWYCEKIIGSNPCGEQMLPPNGNCNLGAVNLAMHVKNPFTGYAHLDMAKLVDTVEVGMRWLDNVIDVSLYPTEGQHAESLRKRRTGLGITGLANMLQQLQLRYGSWHAQVETRRVMKAIRDTAYRTSCELARERGAFPAFDAKYIDGKFVQTLPPDIRKMIVDYGIRNSVLLTVAPTGTTSLYYGNVSSGLEPTFAFRQQRRTLRADGGFDTHVSEDFGYRLWTRLGGGNGMPWPDYMVESKDLTVDDHLEMQAAVQEYIDSSVSKTINVPAECTFEDFREVYTRAYEIGLKGCTTYRPNPESGRGSVLSEVKEEPHGRDNGEPVRPVAGIDSDHVRNTGGAADAGNAERLAVEDSRRAQRPAPALAVAPRPDQLHGTTYKRRWPKDDHAYYITINDHDTPEGLRPFEIFINSKNTTHQEWIAAWTRTASAVFRKGGDVSFLVEELSQVQAADGGFWTAPKPGEERGKFIPSMVAMVGQVLHEHLESLKVSRMPRQDETPEIFYDRKEEVHAFAMTGVPGMTCPRCKAPALVKREGCATCMSCGFSTCD